MIPYTPQDAFTPTDIYDLTDLVKGGSLGVSNTPLKALLDQCTYLYNRLLRFEDVLVSTGSYTYNTADARKAFVFSISANSVFSLPSAGSLPAGTIIAISTRYTAIKALTIQCDGSDVINTGYGTPVSQMFMHTGERLWLVAAAGSWEVLVANGNFFSAGTPFYDWSVRQNSITADGSLITRADMPRLTAFALGLPMGQALIQDIFWLGSNVYSGCFSDGDGVSTIRLPDERGTFTRALDLGRGFDVDRPHNHPGGYEEDEFESHTHYIKEGGDKNLDSTATHRVPTSFIDQRGLNEDIGLIPAGGTETRPKNIGKIPLILY